MNSEGVQQRSPTILLATMWFHRQWFPATGELVSCPGTSNLALSCKVTSNKSVYESSDAVVFYTQGDDFKSSIKELASLRRPVSQSWVMFATESPMNVFSDNLKFLDICGPVNITVTYMQNSDVQSAYYSMVPGVYHGGFNATRNYLEERTRMAAILISNCRVPQRMEWINKIRQYIDVQVYGDCGTECSKSDIQACMAELKKYKFYLSFENSYCRDYISEKIISNAFENDIVPVVIADVNFTDTSVIPPRSAINALDFPSVKELTDHMKKVGNNSALYNTYFKWHSNYTQANTTVYSRRFLCPLCRHLVTNNSTKTYKSVHDWYSKKKLCREYPVPV